MTNAEHIKQELIKQFTKAVNETSNEDLYIFLMEQYNSKAFENTFLNQLFEEFDKVFDHLSTKEKDDYITSGRYEKDFIEWLYAEKLSAIPEDAQHETHKYLSGYCEDNPFKCLSRTDILDELKKSRENYEKGEYKDFDQALNDISKKYDL